MRAIVLPDQRTADTLKAKVDAAHGYPRCERLAGTLTFVGGGRHVGADAKGAPSCACVSGSPPDRACPFVTTGEAPTLALKDGTVAYPVREAQAITMSALSAQERGAIVDVRPDDVAKPVGAAATAATVDAKAAAKP